MIGGSEQLHFNNLFSYSIKYTIRILFLCFYNKTNNPLFFYNNLDYCKTQFQLGITCLTGRMEMYYEKRI